MYILEINENIQKSYRKNICNENTRHNPSLKEHHIHKTSFRQNSKKQSQTEHMLLLIFYQCNINRAHQNATFNVRNLYNFSIKRYFSITEVIIKHNGC